MKILWIFALIILILSAVNLNAIDISQTKNDSIHVISGVPYVSQETDFYCFYTSPTMIFKYFGADTDLKEVLYNSGAGYSAVYNTSSLKRYLISCIGSSNWREDREFLAKLYGLTYSEDHIFDQKASEEENWNEYFSKVKENITNNQPVITLTDPTSLKSIKNIIKDKIKLPKLIWDNIPDYLWRIFPSFTNHVITIVGFNETDNTICFNDPCTALFGDKDAGHYCWMNLSSYRKSMNRLSYYFKQAYFIGSFKNSSKSTLDKEERFLTAHKRNIEKMKGNLSCYSDHVTKKWKSTDLGINTLKQFKKDLDKGLNNRVKTIYNYKYIMMKCLFYPSYKVYKFCDRFLPFFVDIEDFHTQMNYIYQLSIEKNNISNFLSEMNKSTDNQEILDICNREIKLFSEESENCTKLAMAFSKFFEKGLFLSNFKAFKITNEMQMYLKNMIAIEEKLIND